MPSDSTVALAFTRRDNLVRWGMDFELAMLVTITILYGIDTGDSHSYCDYHVHDDDHGRPLRARRESSAWSPGCSASDRAGHARRHHRRGHVPLSPKGWRMSLSLVPLLLHEDDVPASARAALRLANRSSAQHRIAWL